MSIGPLHRSRLVAKLEALENQFSEMPPGLLDLVRSCASSIAGSQLPATFAIALKKGRLERYRHRHHNHKWVPVIEAVTETWNDFTIFNGSPGVTTS